MSKFAKSLLKFLNNSPPYNAMLSTPVEPSPTAVIVWGASIEVFINPLQWRLR